MVTRDGHEIQDPLRSSSVSFSASWDVGREPEGNFGMIIVILESTFGLSCARIIFRINAAIFSYV